MIIYVSSIWLTRSLVITAAAVTTIYKYMYSIRIWRWQSFSNGGPLPSTQPRAPIRATLSTPPLRRLNSPSLSHLCPPLVHPLSSSPYAFLPFLASGYLYSIFASFSLSPFSDYDFHVLRVLHLLPFPSVSIVFLIQLSLLRRFSSSICAFLLSSVLSPFDRLLFLYCICKDQFLWNAMLLHLPVNRL